jgi:hypothetical protein
MLLQNKPWTIPGRLDRCYNVSPPAGYSLEEDVAAGRMVRWIRADYYYMVLFSKLGKTNRQLIENLLRLSVGHILIEVHTYNVRQDDKLRAIPLNRTLQPVKDKRSQLIRGESPGNKDSLQNLSRIQLVNLSDTGNIIQSESVTTVNENHVRLQTSKLARKLSPNAEKQRQRQNRRRPMKNRKIAQTETGKQAVYVFHVEG